MAEDMIECVAAAIAMKSEGWTKNAKDYIPHARAAIEAMRNGSTDVVELVERLQKIAGPVRMENGSFSDIVYEAATALTVLAAKVSEMEAENAWLWGRVDELDKALKIDAVFEYEDDIVTGTTSAPVKRVERQDDGTFTVVINYWPPTARIAALESQLAEALKALDELAADDEPADVEGLMHFAREAASRIREGEKVDG